MLASVSIPDFWAGVAVTIGIELVILAVVVVAIIVGARGENSSEQ